jgi:hypothetical protein
LNRGVLCPVGVLGVSPRYGFRGASLEGLFAGAICIPVSVVVVVEIIDVEGISALWEEVVGGVKESHCVREIRVRVFWEVANCGIVVSPRTRGLIPEKYQTERCSRVWRVRWRDRNGTNADVGIDCFWVGNVADARVIMAMCWKKLGQVFRPDILEQGKHALGAVGWPCEIANWVVWRDVQKVVAL